MLPLLLAFALCSPSPVRAERSALPDASSLFDGGAGSLPLALPRPSRPAPVPRAPRIVIVGAGMSGMSAAWELWDRYRIASVVYEARDRVGGRVWSVPTAAGVVEYGGCFINSTDKALLGLIKRLGLKTFEWPDDSPQNVVADDAGGSVVLSDDALYARYEPTLLKIKRDQDRLGIKAFSRLRRPTAALAPFDSATAERYLDFIQAPQGFKDLAQMYFGDFGRTLGELSALHVLAELRIDPAKRSLEFYDEVYSDESLSVVGGNQQVPLEIERRLDNVQKQWTLAAVDSADQRSYRLRFQTPLGERVVDADYVILTVPFSSLRKWIKLDVGPLPARTADAIASVVQGRNSKLILEFREPYWKTRYGREGTVRSAKMQTWTNNDNKPGKPGSLTVYYNYEVDMAQPGQRAAETLAMLEKAYPGITAEYIGMTVVDWPQDRFAEGSFSGAKAPGQYFSGYPSVEELRAGHLLFAGEHAPGDKLSLVGYMNGAVTSGQEAAKVVAGLIQAESRAQRARRSSPALRP